MDNNLINEELLKAVIGSDPNADNSAISTEAILGLIKTYKPLLETLFGEFITLYKTFAQNEDYIKTVAETKKKIYDSYISVGFQPDQAFSLITSQNNTFANILNATKSIN